MKKNDVANKSAIEQLLEEAAERKRIEPTIIPKAIRYRTAIVTTFWIAYAASLITLIAALVSVFTRRPVTNPIVMLASIATILCMAVFAALVISKHFWKKKLRKLGLFIPMKYD